jgi:hypothetical protein
MSGYLVTGVRRAGKSLVCVGKMRDYIERGCAVATNLDLNLSKLVKAPPTAPVIRMPDRPTAADFHDLPLLDLKDGSDTHNGLLVLDECAVWLNARDWSGGDRSAIIDWLLHSGKLGWDLMFIVQHESLVDKQARLTLFDYTVKCKRMDRIKVPGIGRVLHLLSFGLYSGNLPQIHFATVFYGNGPNAVYTESWFYRGKELYGAYNTRQIIGAGDVKKNQAVPWIEAEPVAHAKPKMKPKPVRLELLTRLPLDERLEVWRRWQEKGLLPA